MKKNGKTNVIMAVFVFLLLLTGCGSQAKVVNMKEYDSPDGTYSIEADESYATTDMGKENADAIGNDANPIEEDSYDIGEGSASMADVSETLRWFNASNSILIYVNGWDYQLYGGLEPNETSQEIAKQILDNSWGVTDKDSADEILYWLLSEGHRTEFAEEMEFLVECGIAEVKKRERASFLYENFEISELDAQIYADWYNRYEESGEDAVSGWDYNRALSQLANFYLAGYYTLEEALDASLNVAEIIQGSFESWDDYMESYFTGYEYWSEESSEERRGIYEELQYAADSPFDVKFKTTLERSW